MPQSTLESCTVNATGNGTINITLLRGQCHSPCYNCMQAMSQSIPQLCTINATYVHGQEWQEEQCDLHVIWREANPHTHTHTHMSMQQDKTHQTPCTSAPECPRHPAMQSYAAALV
eukprot:scaffold150753_cov32-Tisochrysis_lutea.AAC.1